MNEIFDKLILRFIFAIFVCGALYLYRFAHTFLYPSTTSQILNRFRPTQNSAETIHLFSRLIGLATVFSEFYFFISQGILYALLDFTIISILGVILYLLNIYVIESIIFYNFEYQDEIHKRKNLSYAIMSGANAICSGLMIKSIIGVAHSSPILLLFLWLFTLVLIGFTAKAYSSFSKFSFNRLLLQKNLNVGFSYFGYLFGWTFIITHAIDNDITNIRYYVIHVILKIVLCLILIPIVAKGIAVVFKIDEHSTRLFGIPGKSIESASAEDIGKGIFEASIFFIAAYFAIVIAGNVHFGSFYPGT